jgi:hypothetical protein
LRQFFIEDLIVKKSLTKILAGLVALLVISASIFAITPTEVFNDGKRALSLSNWKEAKEYFAKFLKTWPDHKLNNQAYYYRYLAESRYLDQEFKQEFTTKIEKLSSALKKIEKNTPELDTTELKLAIQNLKKFDSPWAGEELSKLGETELLHCISHNWIPNPSKHPMKTLKWIIEWKKQNRKSLNPALRARLYHVQAQALWQIFLSPLPKAANTRILKSWGLWPVHKVLEEALDIGFSTATPSQKRELALLGYHFDLFCHGSTLLKQNSSLDHSRWYNYLQERGLDSKEGWCPR